VPNSISSAATGKAARVAGLALLMLLASAASGQCEQAEDRIRLAIEGFGTAFFGEFQTTPEGAAVLGDGICVLGEQADWTLLADSAVVTGLRESGRFRAEVQRPTLLVEGWRFVAGLLESDGETLALTDVVFTGHGLHGGASHLVLDVEELEPAASAVRVQGRSFRLEAETARLNGQVVDMEGVAITTCTCPGEPFYLITGPVARLDFAAERLDVQDGQLQLAGLRIPLGRQFQLSATAFEDFSLPLALEYRPEPGTGLGLIVPSLELDEGLSLEMGLTGLDADNALQAFALARYRGEDVSFTVGRARGGPRADFRAVRLLTPGVEAAFAISNRHEAASHFLHQGVLELRAETPPLDLPAGAAASLRGTLFAAASAQELHTGTVTSPRLGVVSGARVTVPTGPASTVDTELEARFTDYPAVGASQYGLSLRSAWRYRQGPLTLALDHHRLWTNSGSPFSTTLDRLKPVARLGAQTALAGPVTADISASGSFDVAYDLLSLGGGPPDGLERLGVKVALDRRLPEWTLGFRAGLELAGALDPDPGGTRKAHVEAGVLAERGEWEASLRGRYGLRPGKQGLSLLEAAGAVPLAFEDGMLTPFLAVDFAPLLVRREAPRISGHGLTMTWRSCCGVLRLGYRQQEGSFVTVFGLALNR
jgi:hypothetical protein